MKRMMIAIIAGLFLGLAIVPVFLLTGPPMTNTSMQTKMAAIFILCSVLILFLLVMKLLKQSRREQHKVVQLHNEMNLRNVQLKNQENIFNALFEYANVGMVLCDLSGRLLRVNQSLCQLLGYNENDILEMNLYHLVHPSDVNNMQLEVQHLMDKEIKLHQSEQRYFQKNNDVLWGMTTLSLIRDSEERPIYLAIQVENITLRKTAEEKLRYMAYHDPLTGLANRNKLEQFITHMLASSRRHQQGFGLLFLDLDHFKNINDTIGHEAGDMLLQVVAERLRRSVRTTDMVARLGGDEFVLLITDVKQTQALAIIAQKILNNILETVVIKGQEIYTTTSIGISLYPYDGQNMQTLMKNADLALYRSKQHGRNNYQFYTVEMTTKAQEKMALQNALAHALVKNEFLLHYQPIMDLKTQKIVGVEALLRWQNREYGSISPDEMIALAEETGLILPVSEWVIKSACEQLKQWHSMGLTSLTMAVNCSGRQFKQSTFADDILKIINQIGMAPAFIEIEITESTIMQDPENTLRILYALKDLGLQIAIDDFGTGYWSLSHLRKLSVDKIKIDKTFIKQMSIDETSAAITSAIIAMANKLHIQCVAEGVETLEQFKLLKQEGCTGIQGYYLAHPMDAQSMTQFLAQPFIYTEKEQNQETSFS